MIFSLPSVKLTHILLHVIGKCFSFNQFHDYVNIFVIIHALVELYNARVVHFKNNLGFSGKKIVHLFLIEFYVIANVALVFAI